MTIKQLIALIRRKLLPIIIITLISLLIGFSTYFFTSRNSTYTGTVFINIGSEIEKMTLSQVTDSVQAADQFTETAQGWFRNSSLIDRINAISGYKSTFTVKKQEKQNLSVIFRAQSAASANIIGVAVVQELNREIEKYNYSNNSGFNISLNSVTSSRQSGLLIYLIMLLSALSGALIGVISIYLYEKSTGVAMNSEEIEKIMNKQALDKLNNVNKDSFSFIGAVMNKITHRKSIFIGVDVEAKDVLFFKEKEKNGENEYVVFPKDTLKILDSFNQRCFVVCQIGKSELENIRRLKQILPADFSLLICE